MKVQKVGEVAIDRVNGDDEVRSNTVQSGEVVSESKRDLILVERVLRGDKDAYKQLVEKYQQRAFGLAFEIVKSREDAEDIVQEAFVKAYLSLPDFKKQSAFYTWLYRIVCNMAIDYRRKVARRGGQALSYDENATLGGGCSGNEEKGVLHVIESDKPGPQDELLRKEQANLINRAFETISPEHRLAITLREVDGLSYDEIAEATGVARGTVMSRLHYARKKLQEVLGDFDE